MRIVILAYTFETYATIRLVETLSRRGHEVTIVSPLDCSLEFSSGRSRLTTKGRPVDAADAVVLRCLTYVDNGLPVPRTLEAAVANHFLHGGAFCLNSPTAKRNAVNKLMAGQLLAHAGIPVPRTVLAWNPTELDTAIAMLGTPILLKAFDGLGGIGVVRCDSVQSARSTFDALHSTGQPFLIQEYIAESQGEDIRVLVLGDKILGALRCTPRADDFRSNATRGSGARKEELTAEIEEMSLRASKALGIELGGVDIVESARGPLVLEVNSVPGTERIDAVCRIDSASEIVSFLEAKVELCSIA
jgi:ribosomal protein S6--L-glutamate ligase